MLVKIQFYVTMPDIPSFVQPVLTVRRNLSDLPAVSTNDKLLAKFHSGTLKIINTMRLTSPF